MSLKDVPITHFKVALEELNYRYKVSLALAGLIDEIVDLGSTEGKALAKMGSQTFLPGHSQWMPTCSSALESIFKMTTATSGKQLVGYSSNLSQNISRTFPEHVRGGKRRAAGISTRVLGLVDEYKKAKAVHTRNLEKYNRMVADTELAIKSRNSASEADGRAASLDKDATTSPIGGGDNFVNRSFTKMLSKIAPEKKLDDRCKDMVREVDAMERTLIASSKRLFVQRNDVVADIGKAMTELEELESQRLVCMREGLSRFCLAAELIANQHGETIASVLERTNKLDANAEAMQLLNDIDRPAQTSSPSGKKRADSGASDSDEEQPDSGSELIALFAKAEKIGEAMEYFRSLVSRSATSLTEVAEAEEANSRSAHKVLERHGYMRNSAAQWVYAADYSTIQMVAEPTPMKSAPLSAAIGAVGATTLALAGGLRSGELLSRFESPLTKAGWEYVVCCIGNAADQRMRSAEVATEDVSQQLELVTQRLEIGRRELVEKLASNSKMVENAKAEVKRLTMKLAKCRALIKERRETVKQVREVMASDGMEGSTEALAAAVAADTSESAGKDVMGSPDHASALSASLDEPASAPSARKTSLFRKGGLKQVVGLETLTDRVARIEKQIATLEDEERETSTALLAAEQTLVQVTTVAKTQVLPVFDATREFLSTDLVTIKNAIETLMSNKSDVLASFRNFNRHAKKAHDDIDIPKDLAAFVRAVQVTGDGIPKEQHSAPQMIGAANAAAVVSALAGGPLTLLDVPEMEPFTPTTSEAIIQERAVIAAQQPAPSLYTISNLAMAAYTGGSDTSSEGSPPPGSYSNRLRRNTDDGTVPQSAVAQPGDVPLAVEESASERSAASVVSSQPESAAAPVAVAAPLAASPVPIDSTTSELMKFGLGSQDKIIESYSCALYPKKGLLTHGRLFITQHYAAFSGWPETRVLILLRDIEEVNRTNTLFYVPNALSIVLKDKTEYFLGSFIDREQCLANLVSLSDVGKHMASLPGYDEASILRNLEFGYQTRNNFFGGPDDPDTPPPAIVGQEGPAVLETSASSAEVEIPAQGEPSAPAVRNGGPSTATPVKAAEGAVTPPRGSPVPVAPPSPEQPKTPPRSSPTATSQSPTLNPTPARSAIMASPGATSPAPANTPAPAVVKSPAATPAAPNAPQAKSVTPQPAAAAARSRAGSHAPEPEAVDVEDGINLSTLFERSNISLMQEKVLTASTTKLWSTCWLHGKGYGEFLLEEGEIDINYTEWVPLKNGAVPEDVSKLPFCASRQFSYSHPRTTMLMFGPKNAPTMQTQYLYIPGGRKLDPLDSAALTGLRPARGVVMTLTSFQGIPMCDVFKVLQYWSFERNAADHSRTEMRVGLAIHYIKSSMFKAQIYGGSKEELTVQALKWLGYAERRCQALPATVAAVVVEESTGTGPLRRTSLRRLSGADALQEAAAEANKETETTKADSQAAAVDAATMPTERDQPAPHSETPVTVAKPAPTKSEATTTTIPSVATTAAAIPLPALHINIDTNQLVIALACAVLVLLVLLYRESAHNRALMQQINVLSRKIDLTQTSLEIGLRQSQSVMNRMEAFLNNIQNVTEQWASHCLGYHFGAEGQPTFHNDLQCVN